MTERFQINHSPLLGDVETEISWVKPIPLDSVGLSCVSGTQHYSVAGGQTGFTQVDICSYDYSSNSLKIWRGGVSDWLQKTKMAQAATQILDNIVSARPKFAGLDMSANHLMGVVNVTPDSFSDGGQFLETEAAICHANALISQGASIIDIGGESTRPGAARITIAEERQRVIPVIQALLKHDILVSVDTRNSEIMRTALLEGARIINDVSGFRNKECLGVITDACKAGMSPYVVIMHMQGEPATMQEAPSYNFAPIDIYMYLQEKIDLLVSSGLPRSNIAVDIGFGFGKSVTDNLALVDWMPLFHGLGVPILIGVSRKSTIAKLDNNAPVDERLGGSIALTLKSVNAGVQMIRTHDVRQTAQAIKLWKAGQPDSLHRTRMVPIV